MDLTGMIGPEVLAVIVPCAIGAIFLCYCSRRSNRHPTLDLHNHSRQDALNELDRFIRRNIEKGVPYVRVITGRGLHSIGGVPVLKPTVEARLAQMGLRHWCSRDNPGLIHVNLPSQGRNSPSEKLLEFIIVLILIFVTWKFLSQ